MAFRLVVVFLILAGGLFFTGSSQAEEAARFYKPVPPVQRFYTRVQMMSDLPRVVHPFIAADSLDKGPWYLVRVRSDDSKGQILWANLEPIEPGSKTWRQVYELRGEYRPIFQLARSSEGETRMSAVREDAPWEKLKITDPKVGETYIKRRTYRRYSMVWDGFVFLIEQEKFDSASWSTAAIVPNDHLDEYRAWVDKQGWKTPAGALDAKGLAEANFFAYAHNIIGAANRVSGGLRDEEVAAVAEKIPTLTGDRKALAVYSLLAGGQNPLCKKTLLELIEKECNDSAVTEAYAAAFLTHYQRQMRAQSGWRPDEDLAMMMSGKILKVIEKEKLSLERSALIGMGSLVVGG